MSDIVETEPLLAQLRVLQRELANDFPAAVAIGEAISKLTRLRSELASARAEIAELRKPEDGFWDGTAGSAAVGHLREMYHSAFDALGPSGRVSLRNFINSRSRAQEGR